jgi:integrase
MASIHRDPRFPKGVYYCAYVLADGRRAMRSTGKRDKKEAAIVCQSLQQAENELAGGDLTKDRLTELFNETLKRLGETPIERINIGDWLTDWLTSKENVARNTRLAYGQVVREFLAYLGPRGANRRLESISEKDIRGFAAQLRAEGRSPCTINKLVRKYLSCPFTKAQRLGKIRFNPVIATEAEKFESARRDTFRPEQVASLVEAAKGTDWAGAILFAYGTGARLLDVANLKWASLDLENGIVSFRQRKTGQETIVGLHPDFIDWITERPAADRSQAFVFPTLAGRPSNSSVGLSAHFDAIMKKADVEGRLIREGNNGKGRSLRGLSFHSFRHGAATAVFNGAALKEITRRVTGHAGSVVDKYIHKDLELLREATKLIPRLPRQN